MNCKPLLLMITLIMLLSCGKKNSPKYAVIDKSLGTILNKDEINNSHYCVVIPRAGCGGCIDNASMYVKRNISKFKNVQVIFTGVVDRKLLHLELGDIVLKLPNVHIDKADLFQDLKVKSIYPQVLTLENGITTDIKELDVENNNMSAMLQQ